MEALPDDFEDIADEAMIKLALEMKAKGYPVADIVEFTGLSEEEIKNL